MRLNLQGKKVLITGGSKGIGAATADSFASEGCDLVLVSRSDEALREKAEQLRRDHGVKVETLAADMGSAGVAQHIALAHPHVDVLVNNAGDSPIGTLADVDERRWRDAWDVKLFGYINMCRAYYKAMAERGGGVIVNVTGIGAFTRDPAYICGGTCNAAINTFTESLGAESHRDNVRVLAVCPGPVATDRLTKLGKSNYSAYAFGRAATPSEVANAIVFAASPMSSYTSGTVLTIDGGLSARARRGQ